MDANLNQNWNFIVYYILEILCTSTVFSERAGLDHTLTNVNHILLILKFRYSEKDTNNLPFYLVVSKVFQSFVGFSKCPNFKTLRPCTFRKTFNKKGPFYSF